MVIGSSNTDVFEIGAYSLEAAGSIVPIASSDPQFDLGTLERPWRNFVVSDGSLSLLTEVQEQDFQEQELPLKS